MFLKKCGSGSRFLHQFQKDRLRIEVEYGVFSPTIVTWGNFHIDTCKNEWALRSPDILNSLDYWSPCAVICQSAFRIHAGDRNKHLLGGAATAVKPAVHNFILSRYLIFHLMVKCVLICARVHHRNFQVRIAFWLSRRNFLLKLVCRERIIDGSFT